MVKFDKKEIARDLLAFGSLPFYAIVLVRSTVGRYFPFVAELMIALPIFYLLTKINDDANSYVALSLILVIFTSIFYQDLAFTIFAILLWVLIILSAKTRKEKNSSLVKGVLYGGISSVISYLIVLFI